MELKKALYVSQEIAPYLKPDEMSILGRMIPQDIQSKGYEVRTFMPRYGCINERRNQLHEVIRLSGLNIPIDDADHPLIIKVATLQPTRMQVYFIDNDDYFVRHCSDGLEIDTTPKDNDERIMFFVRGVAETVKKLRWNPEYIHCSGWVTALTPMYLRKLYGAEPAVSDAKIIYSLFDKPFPGTLDPRMKEKLIMEGFTPEDIQILPDSGVDFIALNKLAMDYSDAIVEAVENVPEELLEYAKASGKPFLAYPGAENYIDAYDQFYCSLK